MQRDLHCDAIALGFHVNWFVVQDLLATIEVLHKFGDTAVVFEFRDLSPAGLRVGRTLIGKRDQQSLVEKRELSQALCKRVIVVLSTAEDVLVRKKMDFCTTLLCRASLLQLALWFAFRITLFPHVFVAPDFKIELM